MKGTLFRRYLYLILEIDPMFQLFEELDFHKKVSPIIL